MDDDDRVLAYMHDRLDPRARADFEADLARRPDLRAGLVAMRAVAATMHDETDDTARADGWARLSRDIDATRPGSIANLNRRPAWLQMAAAAVAAVVVWQVLAVPFLPRPDAAGFVPVSEIAEGPILRVAFADQATLAQVAALLDRARARVIDGPSAVGLFTLEFPDETARAAAEADFAARPDLVIAVSSP